MATPTEHGKNGDGYVNGRAAAEMQNDRVRDDVRSSDDRHGGSATGRSSGGLGGWIRSVLRRITGRNRATTEPVAVGALAAGLLLLAACGSGTDPSEVAGTQETQTATTDDTDAADDTEEADAGTGTAVCTDPEDDGEVVDAEANETYEGDAYAADTVEFRIEGTEDRLSIRTQENEDKLDQEPAGPLRFDLWMVSEDGSETGLVRVHSPARGEFDIQVGTDEDSLEPVDGGSPRIVPSGSLLMNVDRDLLPVLEGPFRWAFVETMEGNGTADICPNGAPIDDPLAEIDELASFPS